MNCLRGWRNWKRKQHKEGIKITIQQKIDMARSYAGISKEEFARRMGTTWNALGQRFKTGKFSDTDFEAMAKALGAEYYSGFTFPDGTKI